MTLILWLEVRKLSINLIIANPNDFIEMKFDLTTIDTLQGLHAYMNTLLSSNEEIMRFCLRKVTHFWGHKEGTYVYYMVAPPWVKTLIVRINSIYLNYLQDFSEGGKKKSDFNDQISRNTQCNWI